MPIQKNDELYAAVREVASALESSGATESAAALRDALTISTLPGEVLGEVRMTLQCIRERETNLAPHVQQRMDEAIAYINQVLGR